MLTFESYKLLRAVRKMENATIFVCNDPHYINVSSYTDEDDNYVTKQHVVDFLVQQGYLDQRGRFLFVTHRGWHVSEITLNKFLAFCGRSILVPILVSIVTAYLVSRYFPHY